MIDLYQDRNSYLHNLNARVKLIFTLALIVCINLVSQKGWISFALFLALLFGGFLWGKIEFKTVFLRSLVSTPFILAAFPLVFSTDGPFFNVPILGLFDISVSQPGLARFAVIAIKSWLCLLSAIFLTSITRYEDIITALRQLGLPKVFVSILTLMWRYLSLIIDEARSLARAKESRSAANIRTGRPSGSIIWRAHTTGRMVGNLFLRSIDRSERVYAAMTARGYGGESSDSHVDRINSGELLLLAAAILLCLFGIAVPALIP